MQLKRDLSEPLRELQETSRSIAEVQRECKLEVNTEEYVESFKAFLMDVIFAWSKVRDDTDYRCLGGNDSLLLSSNLTSGQLMSI